MRRLPLFLLAAGAGFALAACTQEQTERAAHPGQVTEGTSAQAAAQAEQNSSDQPTARSAETPAAPNARLDDTTPGQSNTAPSHNPQPPQ